jgi:hypothetical protein
MTKASVTSSQSSQFIDAEVAWRHSRTFDIFAQVWQVNGVVLAGQRWDANDFRYQHVQVPKASIDALKSSLRKVDKSAEVYLKV